MVERGEFGSVGNIKDCLMSTGHQENICLSCVLSSFVFFDFLAILTVFIFIGLDFCNDVVIHGVRPLRLLLSLCLCFRIDVGRFVGQIYLSAI